MLAMFEVQIEIESIICESCTESSENQGSAHIIFFETTNIL